MSKMVHFVVGGAKTNSEIYSGFLSAFNAEPINERLRLCYKS